MFEFVRCCQCGEPVRLPDSSSVVWVRCPHCRAEYPLEMIVNELPPVLEVIPHVGSVDTVDAERSRHMTRRRRSGPFAVALGGIAGLVLGQLVLWWLPEPYRTDPLGLGPKIPQSVSFLAPPSIRGDVEIPLLADNDTLDVPPHSEPGAGVSIPLVDSLEPARTDLAPPPGQMSIPQDASPGTAEVFVGLADAPRIAMPELRKSLRAAAEVSRSLSSKSEWSDELVAKWQSQMCEFAYCVTFADMDETGITQFARDARELLTRVLGNERKRLALGGAGAKFVGDPARHRQGVLIAGTAKAITAVGRLFQTDVELAGQPGQVVHVVSRSDPRQQKAFDAGDEVLIAGVVVADPGLHLLGYQGNADVVVLGGLPVSAK